ncbi:hypothetical protein [Rhizobium lentis]|uniref:hypothetical protein n=1 Tax=Rhizobium lentis TaxID=1138194 RepID=UPI001C837ACF|nr:hypothetical protein [Rhizobium lentis]MBX5143960.1 hypothetical protein [Rhizobium lentis]
MGVEIVRVPADWDHPVDEEGELLEGGHHEPLYRMDDGRKTAFQLYENVSDGIPVSPVLATREALAEWLAQNGWSAEALEFLLANGHAPSMVKRL